MSTVRVVGAQCQLGRHESESTLGKRNGKTGRTQISGVGSIVATDDYLWGPTGGCNILLEPSQQDQPRTGRSRVQTLVLELRKKLRE